VADPVIAPIAPADGQSIAERARAAHAGGQAAGCPFVHEDYSKPKEACGYLSLADEMRETGPLFFNEFAQGYWVFTRHDAVQDIYKTPEIFSSESITPWQPEPAYRFIPTQLDAPEHLKYRRIVNPWFSPRRVADADEMVRSVCRSYVEEIAPKGECELVGGFALQFPTEVFLTIIGADPAMTDAFVGWVEDFFKGFGGDPDGVEPMLAALASIRGHWEQALEERRGEPEPREGDLASHLLHATVDDRPLNDTEILDMLVVLVLAGLDTTRGTLGYIFHHLAEHPEHRRRLIAEPELIPSFVEEALRYYTIIFGDGRKVTRDIEFHGASLKKGDMVYGLVAGANRDPRHYERADEFVIDRKKNTHFGFAGGPHRCLGMHLARRELAVGVEEWLRAIPDFHVATDEPLMERGGGNMTTLLRLPLAWERQS
jgi:cytochrome P450